MTQIKICGITTNDALREAAKAEFVGFVFANASPRFLTEAKAKDIAARAHGMQAKRVGLFVDATDTAIDAARAVLPLDMLQLHGEEDVPRVRDIRSRTGLKVMKAIRVARAADIARAQEFFGAADWILFDAHVPGEAGGTGQTFDWTLLRGFAAPVPWMLSGGLNAANVASALSVVKPDAVDVSSGVESSRGVKDTVLIADFIGVVRQL